MNSGTLVAVFKKRDNNEAREKVIQCFTGEGADQKFQQSLI